MDDTQFFSYKTSSNIESAKILANFIREISPETKVIIHRDRDFMNEDEVKLVSDKISECGAMPFITEGADMESYFVHSLHISLHVGAPRAEVKNWLDGIAKANHNELQHVFTRKRDEVKYLLYKNINRVPPDTLVMLGNDVPLPFSKRQGKLMFKWVRADIHNRFGVNVNLQKPTDALKSSRLKSIREQGEPIGATP